MTIRKSLRFEIFKRDSFTCQYCGGHPPEIMLEVDHIIPRSQGGKDDFENLVTACSNCNRGKGKRPLEFTKIRGDLIEETKRLMEQEEQLKEYYKIIAQIRKREDEDIDKINDGILGVKSEFCLTDEARECFRPFLKDFTLDRILEAVNIINRQVHTTYIPRKLRYTFGILHNWRRQRSEE